MFGKEDSKFIQKEAVSDFILERAKEQYGLSNNSKALTKEDIFYYVYGILHSKDYRTTFANDLKKSLPRLPLVERIEDFWAFSQAGRRLANLHLNYETAPPYKEVEVIGDHPESGEDLYEFYRVSKMSFPKGKAKHTIHYNSRITITNIPEKVYQYVVNGKTAIEWILESYQIKTDKKSGITKDPNDWAKEVKNPRYILDLLLSVINVSVQTVEIVDSLPSFKFVSE